MAATPDSMPTDREPPRSRPVVQIIDPIHPAGVAHLSARYQLIPHGVQPDADERAATAAFVVRTSPITAAMLDASPLLRLVAKHGSGIDNIDVAAATARGVLVANTPGGTNATAVAEGAVTLMLATLRRVREMDALVRAGDFERRWSLRLGDLTGGRLGLVGFGQIARAVARICGAGFGMSVSAYDPFVAEAEMAGAGVAKVQTLAALMTNDVVSVHVGLSDATRNLIDAAALDAMHSGGVLVNTSRGGLVDEVALVRALSEGRIAGAGVDVFEHEPPQRNHPLFALSNVVLSPHVAGVTEGSMRGMALAVAHLVDQVMAGERPLTTLNDPAPGGSRCSP